MSWLNVILEEILNEINSKDAYERFYNMIPYEDFQKVIGGETNIDKFSQYFLNAVRDSVITADDAAEGLALYRNADPLVKQAVLNRFRSGEYESVYELIEDIEQTSSSDAVLSPKKFAKEGYLKIIDTENWVLTATINYEANSHYFGKSQWCTASDRSGRYDGYEMFQRYSLNNDSCLYQISKKSNPSDAFQIAMCADGSTTQICDFSDDAHSMNHIKVYFGRNGESEEFNVLYDNMKKWAPKVIELTEQMSEKESKYQERREEIMKKRRAKIEKACKEYNAKKLDKIEEMWDNFLSNKEFLNKEFIESFINDEDRYTYYSRSILDGDTMEDMLQDERKAEQNRYLYISYVSDNCIVIYPIKGYLKDPDGDFFSCNAIGSYNDYLWVLFNGENIKENFSIKDYGFGFPKAYDIFDEDSMEYIGNIIIVIDEKSKKGKLFANNEDDAYEFYTPSGNWNCIQMDKFLIFIPVNQENEYSTISDVSDNCPVIRMSDKKIMEVLNVKGWKAHTSNSHTVHFSDANKILSISDYYKGRKIQITTNCSNNVIKYDHTNEILIFGDEYYNSIGSAVISNGGIYSLKLNKIVYQNKEVYYQAYRRRLRKRDENNNKNGVAFLKPHTRKLVYWTAEDGYFIYKKDQKIPCDENGDTQEDKIARKNFQDWQSNGGHSQRAKDEMDRMWKDKEAGELNPNKVTDDVAWADYEKREIYRDAEDIADREWRWWKQEPENQGKTFRDLVQQIVDTWDESIHGFKDWDDADVPSNQIDESYHKYKSLIKRMNDL